MLEGRILDPELTEFVRKLSASPETEPAFSIREFTQVDSFQLFFLFGDRVIFYVTDPQESFMLDPDSSAASPTQDSRKTQV